MCILRTGTVDASSDAARVSHTMALSMHVSIVCIPVHCVIAAGRD